MLSISLGVLQSFEIHLLRVCCLGLLSITFFYWIICCFDFKFLAFFIHFGDWSSLPYEVGEDIFKAFKKEIEEDTRKWKDLLCSWVGKINIVKMVILPKAIYKFNAMPSKILHRSWKNNTQLHMEKETNKPKARIAKTILYNKESSGGITISDLKIYYKVIVLKIAYYCHKSRQEDQWNQNWRPGY